MTALTADNQKQVIGPGGDARHAAQSAVERIDLMGMPIHRITERGCIELILTALDGGAGGWVVTPNLDILRRWRRDESFRELVAGVDLIVADGMPLVWASRLQRTPLPERVAGSTMISTLSAAAGARGRSVYLLGGEPGSAEESAAELLRRHPSVRIAGMHCPAMGFEASEAAMEEIERRLVEAAPDIVFVALGSPKQERLIRRLRERLPGAWWLGVGISFSFLAGRVRRAPIWMQRIGLEWAHRLMQEPRRLAKRYLVDGLPFAARLLVESAWRGATRRGKTRGARA